MSVMVHWTIALFVRCRKIYIKCKRMYNGAYGGVWKCLLVLVERKNCENLSSSILILFTLTTLPPSLHPIYLIMSMIH